MTQDTYTQAVELQEKINGYNEILAIDGDLFQTDLGPNFDKARTLDIATFTILRETMSDDLRAAITTQRDAAQTEFDALQDA